MAHIHYLPGRHGTHIVHCPPQSYFLPWKRRLSSSHPKSPGRKRAMEGRDHLKEHVVGSLPTLIYIPNFITDSDQAHLLHQIYQALISKWKSLKNRRLQNWGGVVHEKGLLPQDLPIWLTKITQKICERTGLFPSPINHVLINEYLPDQGIMPHQDGPAYFPVVAILSLGSPAVMNFTPHSKLRECTSNKRTVAEGSCSDEGAKEFGTNELREDKSCHPIDENHRLSVLLMPCSLLIFKDAAYSDYLHGIEDSSVHSLDEVVNIAEALKHPTQISSMSTEEAVKTNIPQQCINRTNTRVSLTCRLVLKVHRNLFKF